MCIFALSTGLRVSNVAGMKWSKIHLKQKIAWVSALNAKAGKPIGVSLNEDAMAVLARRKGKYHTYVFTYQGNPIKYPRASWENALNAQE